MVIREIKGEHVREKFKCLEEVLMDFCVRINIK